MLPLAISVVSQKPSEKPFQKLYLFADIHTPDHDTCTWPNEKVYMGRVECPQDKVEDGLVLAGNT